MHWVLLFSALLFAQSAPATVRVAAAASLVDVLEEASALYAREHAGVEVKLMLGATGALERQLREGAPIDLFISAAAAPVERLVNGGLLDGETRVVLATNTLVLIAPASDSRLRSFAGLKAESVKRIALGDPESVPAGQYAAETLKELGLSAAIEKKRVLAKDVRQVLAYVESGDADAGLVYRSDAEHSKKVRVVEAAKPLLHAPIVYPAAVVAKSPAAEATRDFLGQLLSPRYQKLFKKHGFK